MSDQSISRRTLARGAAWSIPVVTIAAAAPAMAASCSAATAPTVIKRASMKHNYQDASEKVNIFTSNGDIAVPQQVTLSAYVVFQTTDLNAQANDFTVTASNNGIEVKNIKKSEEPVPTFDNNGEPITDANGNPVMSKTEKRVRTEITIALTKPLDVGESIIITDPTYTSNGYYQEYGYDYTSVTTEPTFDPQTCQNVVTNMQGGGGAGGEG